MLNPRNVTWLGLIVNALLAIAKVSIGLLCRSQTLFADGLHSASDIISDIAVLAGIRVSEKPADETHHYGHLRHNISTRVRHRWSVQEWFHNKNRRIDLHLQRDSIQDERTTYTPWKE